VTGVAGEAVSNLDRRAGISLDFDLQLLGISRRQRLHYVADAVSSRCVSFTPDSRPRACRHRRRVFLKRRRCCDPACGRTVRVLPDRPQESRRRNPACTFSTPSMQRRVPAPFCPPRLPHVWLPRSAAGVAGRRPVRRRPARACGRNRRHVARVGPRRWPPALDRADPPWGPCRRSWEVAVCYTSPGMFYGWGTSSSRPRHAGIGFLPLRITGGARQTARGRPPTSLLARAERPVPAVSA
jgi:hypothetical protein